MLKMCRCDKISQASLSSLCDPNNDAFAQNLLSLQDINVSADHFLRDFHSHPHALSEVPLLTTITHGESVTNVCHKAASPYNA